MGMKLSSIQTNVSDDGDWVEIPEWPGVRLKVRSINSKDYQVGRQFLVQKLTRRLGRQPTNPEMEPELGRLVAKHLLRGWEGIDDDAGKPLEFTPVTGTEYLTNAAYAELEGQVIWAASVVGASTAQFSEDAIKNSAAP